jgi:hypothetical protein
MLNGGYVAAVTCCQYRLPDCTVEQGKAMPVTGHSGNHKIDMW